jgi:E3 ubiquitin-protein ligase MARCH6
MALPLFSPGPAMYIAPKERELGVGPLLSGSLGTSTAADVRKGNLEKSWKAYSFFRDPESASPDSPPSNVQDQASIATIPDTLLEDNEEEDHREEDDISTSAAKVDRLRDDEDGEGDNGDVIN